MRSMLLIAVLSPWLLAGCSSAPGGAVDAPQAAPEAAATVELPTMDPDAVFGRWYEPIEANLFVAPRASKLYIAWALPKDLMPLGAVSGAAEVEPFLVNSAWALCRRFDPRAAPEQTDCLVQLLRLQSNDEYTKSAAGGFSTVGKMEASRDQAMATETTAMVSEPRSAVRARFSRIDLDLSGFDLAAARAAAAAHPPVGAVRGGE
jgi:hypothetical protein